MLPDMTVLLSSPGSCPPNMTQGVVLPILRLGTLTSGAWMSSTSGQCPQHQVSPEAELGVSFCTCPGTTMRATIPPRTTSKLTHRLLRTSSASPRSTRRSCRHNHPAVPAVSHFRHYILRTCLGATTQTLWP